MFDKNIRMFINILEICIKYPKLGLLDPNFVKTGDELKNQDENSAVKKEGIQTVSLSKLFLTRILYPVLDLP
jgi:hypothetical protein